MIWPIGRGGLLLLDSVGFKRLDKDPILSFPDFSSHTHCCFSENIICNETQFLCQGEDICIPNAWACDGVADCDGAEDEQAQTCGNYLFPKTWEDRALH